jgi:hypothetical protein
MMKQLYSTKPDRVWSILFSLPENTDRGIIRIASRMAAKDYILGLDQVKKVDDFQMRECRYSIQCL